MKIRKINPTFQVQQSHTNADEYNLMQQPYCCNGYRRKILLNMMYVCMYVY